MKVRKKSVCKKQFKTVICTSVYCKFRTHVWILNWKSQLKLKKKKKKNARPFVSIYANKYCTFQTRYMSVANVLTLCYQKKNVEVSIVSQKVYHGMLIIPLSLALIMTSKSIVVDQVPSIYINVHVLRLRWFTGCWADNTVLVFWSTDW